MPRKLELDPAILETLPPHIRECRTAKWLVDTKIIKLVNSIIPEKLPKGRLTQFSETTSRTLPDGTEININVIKSHIPTNHISQGTSGISITSYRLLPAAISPFTGISLEVFNHRGREFGRNLYILDRSGSRKTQRNGNTPIPQELLNIFPELAPPRKTSGFRRK